MSNNVTYLYPNLPPYLGAMQRLMEDDIASTEPGRAAFLESVRGFAAYEVGGRFNGKTAN